MNTLDPHARARPQGPRPMPEPSLSPSNPSPVADIVIGPGPRTAQRRQKRALLDAAGPAPRVLPPVFADLRPLPMPPGVQSLLRRPLPPLPVTLIDTQRHVTMPPLFRPDPASLVLNEPFDLRDENNRPTPRLMAHVFSLNEAELGGTFLTQAHEEMVALQRRFCAVRRPGLEDAQHDVRANLEELEFSLRMSRTLESFHEEPLGRSLANIADAVMRRLDSSHGRAVFPGGLVGHDERHAILFEMSRRDGNVRLRVYNTGTGIEHHHADARAPTRFQSFLEVENVDPKALQEPQLIETLLGFSMPTMSDTLAQRIAAFYALFKALGDVAGLEQTSKPQGSPNCAWKVLSAFNKSHGTAVSTLQFKAFTQSRVLEHFMNDNGIASQADLMDWEAGRYDNGAQIERLVGDAAARFAKTEEKLRQLLGARYEPALDVRAFIKTQRAAVETARS